MTKGPLLFEGKDWTFDTIRRIHDAVERHAIDGLGLVTYPNQIEIITSEQMLDAYASVGMPLFYKHWSFGKHFAQQEMVYRKGLQGLAYEIVINSNPCISYIMEENTATMQTLVIAHAAFGHNHFFRNNYQFQQWTDPSGILDYLSFAKNYVARCEERHGQAAVERLLDAAHALMPQGVHRYPRKGSLNLQVEEQRERSRKEEQERVYNDLWRTVPGRAAKRKPEAEEKRRALLGLPQENILYFIEKFAPKLEPWQREILRIVRLVSQYFYPQQQTKVMNEGCACYVHYDLMRRLHDNGEIDDGSYLEFLTSHTNVVRQPVFEDRHYGGINPYALGFEMMTDIARIAEAPTAEDRQWFPDIAGKGDAIEILKDVWANYRDDSFIAQFLSPRVIRKWRMFSLLDDQSAPTLEVTSIHNDRGYRQIRQSLSSEYDIGRQAPDIQVVDVDLTGSRRLVLHHTVPEGRVLVKDEAQQVLKLVAELWGYEVLLREVEQGTERVLAEHAAGPSGH